MEKHLIGITERQKLVISNLAEELGLSFSEVVRRGLDHYIDHLVDKGDLVRFTMSANTPEGEKSFITEWPKKLYQQFYTYAKNHPNVFSVTEEKE